MKIVLGGGGWRVRALFLRNAIHVFIHLTLFIAAFPVEWKESPNDCVKQVHKITSKFHAIIIFIGKPSRVHAKEAAWQLEQQLSRTVDREFPVLLVCYTDTSMLNN